MEDVSGLEADIGLHGTRVFIRVLGLSLAVTVAGDDAEKQPFSKCAWSLSPPVVAFNDNGVKAGGDNGDSTVGDGVEADGQVAADDGDVVTGDDVSAPGFLASRGRDPFVLILNANMKNKNCSAPTT